MEGAGAARRGRETRDERHETRKDDDERTRLTSRVSYQRKRFVGVAPRGEPARPQGRLARARGGVRRSPPPATGAEGDYFTTMSVADSAAGSKIR